MLSAVAVYKDLFLTQRHFIKGNLSPHVGRLSDYLDHSSEDFVALQDVLLADLRDGSSTPSPSLLLNPREIVFAHELIEVGGDVYRRVATRESDLQYVKVVFSGSDPITIRGKMRKDALDRSHREQRFFVLSQPRIENVPESLEQESALLDSLSYVILNKRQVGHIFEF